MMSSEIVLLFGQLVAIVVLLFINGFFVSVEFAYVTVRHPRIDQLALDGNRSATLVQKLIGDTDRVLAVSQIGITTASLAIGWVGENAADKVIRLAFGIVPTPLDSAVAHSVALVLAFMFITSLHIVLGEQAPKIVAIREADRIATMSARFVATFDALAAPLVALLDNATAAVVRLVGLEPLGAHKTVYSVDELKQLVEETQQHGELEPHEKEMIHNVFEFDDKVVREVMIPRPEIVGVAEDTTVADFLQTFSAASHARFPIYVDTVDHITGFLAIKDLLRSIAAQGMGVLEQPVRSLRREALFVPESKRIGELFAEMQSQRTRMAIVIDEFGGTAGMVTGDQLIEEIVGRLRDEMTKEDQSIEMIDEHTSQVDAGLRIAEANEQLGLALPEDENYETVAGYILHTLRRIPKEGEQFKVGSLKLTITDMAGPKIEKVLITRL